MSSCSVFYCSLLACIVLYCFVFCFSHCISRNFIVLNTIASPWIVSKLIRLSLIVASHRTTCPHNLPHHTQPPTSHTTSTQHIQPPHNTYNLHTTHTTSTQPTQPPQNTLKAASSMHDKVMDLMLRTSVKYFSSNPTEKIISVLTSGMDGSECCC